MAGKSQDFGQVCDTADVYLESRNGSQECRHCWRKPGLHLGAGASAWVQWSSIWDFGLCDAVYAARMQLHSRGVWQACAASEFEDLGQVIINSCCCCAIIVLCYPKSHVCIMRVGMLK